jgi:hypothetical protein
MLDTTLAVSFELYFDIPHDRRIPIVEGGW